MDSKINVTKYVKVSFRSQFEDLKSIHLCAI